MDYYDDLETRDPEQRERALFSALPGQIAHARANAPYFARLLKDVEANEVHDRKALAKLPVTRKSDLIALQKENPPFAGMTAVAAGALGRVFSSPGPIGTCLKWFTNLTGSLLVLTLWSRWRKEQGRD